MKKYTITKDGVQELLSQMIFRINQIEVKGDSVNHLFILKSMLEELIGSIKEEESPEDSGTNKNGGE
jgi:hypothetical protein